jgi:MIP family channel proteins
LKNEEREMPRLSSALVAEAIGTFLFFFVGMGAVVLGQHTGDTSGGLVGVALAHGLALAVLVSALGAVSGGHFNPAVTFAVWITGRIEPVRAALYVIAQLIAAVAAGFALSFVFPEASWDAVNLGTPALGEGIDVMQGIVIEAVLTMVLLVAVFGTAIDPRAPKIGGLAIGLAVAADIFMGGPLTGAAMNPARWFGPAVASGTFDDWYVWWIGPLVGAAIIALVYRFVWEETGEPEVTPATPEG